VGAVLLGLVEVGEGAETGNSQYHPAMGGFILWACLPQDIVTRAQDLVNGAKAYRFGRLSYGVYWQ
ncbi:hypothetical protein, partial [Pontibacter sp. 13R65]|uniref:hypothetical protein n=1 Tax=Pontibacter sp. 13R65 TaxID=3127458 RepID=UPI00301D6D33